MNRVVREKLEKEGRLKNYGKQNCTLEDTPAKEEGKKEAKEETKKANADPVVVKAPKPKKG